MKQRLIAVVVVVLLASTSVFAQAPGPIMASAMQAAAQAGTDLQPKKSGMPTGYKVGGIILLAAGTYYLISAAVADSDSVNMPQYRTAWIVMGTAGLAAGALVLNAGHRKGMPALVFSGKGVALRSPIPLGKWRHSLDRR